MKSYQNLVFSLGVVGFSVVSYAEKPDSTQQKIDVAEQQRQQQYQQHQAEKLNTKPDVRLETRIAEKLTLSNQEYPCYPIHHITLTDYFSSSPVSQFQWAFDKAAKSLKLSLPHCFGGEGLGILMKQVQNEIIGKGYVTTRVVVEEQDLRSGKLMLTVIKGKVRNTIVVDNGNIPRFTPLHAFTGLTFASGDILNIRDIEQSLENLKRVPTVEANIEILPSESGKAEVYGMSEPFKPSYIPSVTGNALDNSSSKMLEVYLLPAEGNKNEKE